MFDLSEELAVIRDVLVAKGLEFAVCGGIAIAIHGFIRATEDIDLFVRSGDADAIRDTLGSLGYVDMSPQPAVVSGIEIQHIAKSDTRDRDVLSVDLLLRSSATSDVWNSRELLMWRDAELPVVSRDGLIALKRLRGTNMDLVDIGRMQSEGKPGMPISFSIERFAQLRGLCRSLAKAGREARAKGVLS